MFSNQPHSGTATESMIEKILPFIKNDTIIEILNFTIRKLAHITEYFILTLLVYSLSKEYTKNEKKRIIISILFSMIYSCTDELHQNFVPGRTGVYKDCLIDSIGCIIFLLIKNIHHKTYKA